MMFTARAKTTFNNQWAEGLVFSMWNRYNDCEDFYICSEGTLSVEENSDQIDEDTLQLSFNDGTDWYDVATIKEALTKQQVSNDVCKNCKYLGDEILLSSPAKRDCHNSYSAYSYLYHKEINVATCDKFEPKTLDKGELFILSFLPLNKKNVFITKPTFKFLSGHVQPKIEVEITFPKQEKVHLLYAQLKK